MTREMRHVGGSVSAAALVLLAAACTGDAASDGAGDVPELAELAGEVTLSIGTLEGPEPYSFGRVAGLAADGEDRVYVADGQAAEVRVFSPEGTFLYRVGRRGQGPGELGTPCCLAFGPEGLLWVRDGGNARYAAYRIHGGDSASWERQLPMSHGDVNRAAPVTFRGDSLVDVGLVMEQVRDGDAVRMRSRGLGRAYLPLQEGDPRTEMVPEPDPRDLGVEQVTRTSESGRSTYFLYPPMGPLHRVAHGPDGRWASLRTDAWRVELRQADAAPRVVERPTPEGPTVSDAQRERAEERVESYRTIAGSELPAALERIPDRLQPLRNVYYGANGRLWVEASVPEGEPRRADLLDDEGRLVERRTWPADVELAFPAWVGRDVAVGLRTDSLGVPRVVRVDWDSPGGG